MTQTYRIETITDMLKVPTDRREEMLRELAYALDLCQFARGDQATMDSFVWTDDGKTEIRLDSPGSGDDGLMLRVVKDSQAQEGKQP